VLRVHLICQEALSYDQLQNFRRCPILACRAFKNFHGQPSIHMLLSDGPLLILPHFHQLHQGLPWSLGRLMGAIEPCCHKHGILNSYDRVVSQTFFGAVVQEMAGSKFSQFSRLGSPCPVFFLSQAIYLMSSTRRVHGRLFSAKEAGLLCPFFFLNLLCSYTSNISNSNAFTWFFSLLAR